MPETMYRSTRGNKATKTASQAILKGIAEDGGLFVPDRIPTLDKPLEAYMNLSYQELAYEILKLYYTDFTKEELQDCIAKAYDEKFDTKKVAPLIKAKDHFFLELFHGKTLAFKDMALSILPHLLTTSMKKNNIDKEVIILTATSGDTGKAALEGFKDVPGTKIIVFYPCDGVSEVQKRQMVTQEGNNVWVYGVRGNFDDAQTGVKKIFTDATVEKMLAQKGWMLSSANSINIGRLFPQVVYYFYAYAQMVQMGEITFGDKINFTVPTGNFGNILAGYFAKQMGLPVAHFICASNENKILYDFLQTGDYDTHRPFVLTASPSMDILISSNLERLIYLLSDSDTTNILFQQLAKEGKYKFDTKVEDIFGQYANDMETKEAIQKVYKTSGYVMDTHTAVAYCGYEKYYQAHPDGLKNVIVSTASPYKFVEDVCGAIEETNKDNPFQLFEDLSRLSHTPVPKPIENLDQKPILHKDVCNIEQMLDVVLKAER